MNADQRTPLAPVDQSPGGAGDDLAKKPTRAECMAAAAPHLAALVLARRARLRAQAADNGSSAAPPSAA